MLNNLLAGFYERDLCKLIEEISLFERKENLWKTTGDIKNSAGNIALHIIGGTNYLIGSVLAGTGYIRNRNEEFTTKNIKRNLLITQLKALITLVNTTIQQFTQQQMDEEYPVFFDKPGTTVSYVFLQLLLHLNYHTGQVNYLRRMLE